MSKARTSATKLISRHELRCKREHARMQAAIINAFLRAVAPWFSDEDSDALRRAVDYEMVRPRRKR